MSQAEQERSQEQREASDSEAEQVQQFGAVFYITVAISAVFVLAGVFFTEPFGSALATVVGWITSGLGWLYMLMTSFFLAFAVWLACLVTARSGSASLTTDPSSTASRGSRCSSRPVWASASCSGASPSPSRTTQIRRSAWPGPRRQMQPHWLCRLRSSTGGYIRGRSSSGRPGSPGPLTWACL